MISISVKTEKVLSARYMFEGADYVGRVSQAVQLKHNSALQQAGVSGETSLIMGGRIQGQPHSLVMIYPQGNCIEASATTPYLQIGETKYGKPLLDRVLDYQTDLGEAAKLALVSLILTANSNITVGGPFELSTYRSGQFQLSGHCKFDVSGEYLSNWENAGSRA